MLISSGIPELRAKRVTDVTINDARALEETERLLAEQWHANRKGYWGLTRSPSNLDELIKRTRKANLTQDQINRIRSGTKTLQEGHEEALSYARRNAIASNTMEENTMEVQELRKLGVRDGIIKELGYSEDSTSV